MCWALDVVHLDFIQNPRDVIGLCLPHVSQGMGRPERLEALAVVCGEAVSLLREHVASKRIVVLRHQADTTDLNVFCEKGSQGNVLMLKGERW